MCLFIEAAQGYHNSSPSHSPPPPASHATAPSKLLFVFDPAFITHALVLFVSLSPAPPFVYHPPLLPVDCPLFLPLSFRVTHSSPTPNLKSDGRGRDRLMCTRARRASCLSHMITDPERANISENLTFPFDLLNKTASYGIVVVFSSR